MELIEKMKNKVLVELIVPELEEKYDVYIPVNKKIGNSVMRSRAKRLMSEVVRLNINKITNKNYVVVVKPSILNCEFKELEKEFLNVIQKANLIKKDLNE